MLFLLLAFLFLSLLLIFPLGLKNGIGEKARLEGSDRWMGICRSVAGVGVSAGGIGNVCGVRERGWGRVW